MNHEAESDPQGRKDTVLLRSGQPVDILLDVSNPGLWMAHCHIAERIQTGMMFSFNVARRAAEPESSARCEGGGVMGAQHDTPLDVVIVGGSQAGLAVAYYLKKRGLRFALLDAGPEIGHAWKSRWDSLTLFTPAQYSGLPGLDFPAAHDVYPSKDEVVAYLQSYASAFDLPVRPNARVTSVTRSDQGYLVATEDEVFRASQVVVATGPFQAPLVPQMARDLDASVAQIHSTQYRNLAQLPEGPALVVGGGNSGFQIAAELVETRKVDLAVGTRMPALPQRLLGRDLFWWLTHLGIMRVSVESRLGRRMAKRDVLIGSSRRRLLRAGVTIRKRLERFEGRRAVFADGSRSGRRGRGLGHRVPVRLHVDRGPRSRGRGRSRPAPARGDGRSRPLLRRPPLAAHPGIGAPGLHAGRCRLHR